MFGQEYGRGSSTLALNSDQTSARESTSESSSLSVPKALNAGPLYLRFTGTPIDFTGTRIDQNCHAHIHT